MDQSFAASITGASSVATYYECKLQTYAKQRNQCTIEERKIAQTCDLRITSRGLGSGSFPQSTSSWLRNMTLILSLNSRRESTSSIAPEQGANLPKDGLETNTPHAMSVDIEKWTTSCSFTLSLLLSTSCTSTLQLGARLQKSRLTALPREVTASLPSRSPVGQAKLVSDSSEACCYIAARQTCPFGIGSHAHSAFLRRQCDSHGLERVGRC